MVTPTTPLRPRRAPAERSQADVAKARADLAKADKLVAEAELVAQIVNRKKLLEAQTEK